MKQLAFFLAAFSLALPADAGLFSPARAMDIPGMAELPVIDGILDDWPLDQARVPRTRSSIPGRKLGDIYISWLPEGIAVAVVYTDTPAGNNADNPCRLTMGFVINDERPVAFTLAGIQEREDPKNPGSGFRTPVLKSVRGGKAFPLEGRFTANQAKKGGKKTVEMFLPAGLFGREEIDPADELRVYASLKIGGNRGEIFFPRPFKAPDFWNDSRWARMFFLDNPGATTRKANKNVPGSGEGEIPPVETPVQATALEPGNKPESSAGLTGTKGKERPAEAGKLAMTNPVLSPSPFKPGGKRLLTVKISLNKPAKVTVIVYDKRKKIIHRFPEQDCQAGINRFTWNGAAGKGKVVAKGDYLVGIISTNGTEISSHIATLLVRAR